MNAHNDTIEKKLANTEQLTSKWNYVTSDMCNSKQRSCRGEGERAAFEHVNVYASGIVVSVLSLLLTLFSRSQCMGYNVYSQSNAKQSTPKRAKYCRAKLLG